MALKNFTYENFMWLMDKISEESITKLRQLPIYERKGSWRGIKHRREVWDLLISTSHIVSLRKSNKVPQHRKN